MSVVRAKFDKALGRILRRGVIKTDDEFYLVRNAAEAPSEHQTTLWTMIDAYENRASG